MASSRPTSSRGEMLSGPSFANPQSSLAAGSITPEEEIEARSRLADLLILQYDRGTQRNVQDLRHAIENSEAILRRLPRDSPQRPKHLNRLSYARMSEYTASRSQRAIDEAVRCGRLAKLEAAATGLLEKDVRLYCEILNNVGFALSHRCQHGQTSSMSGTGGGETEGSEKSTATADLDEAIDCAREIKTLSLAGSRDYSMALLNLASRLEFRSSSRGHPADHEKAVELLRELQLISTSGSMSGLATIQLGQMALEKFKKTGALEDLDDGLRHIKDGVHILAEDSELRPQILHLVTTLYSSRHEKTKDVADLRNAVSFSNMTLVAVPVSHGVRAGYLLQHMRLLRDFTKAISSAQEVNEAALTAHKHLLNMPNEYRERHTCHTFYGDVLGRKYILSRKLEDLNDAVGYIINICHEYNDNVKQSGTRPQVNTSLLYGLSINVRKLSLASPGQVRDVGAEKLYDQIARTCNSKDFVNGILSVKNEFVTLLGIYADAASRKEAITEEDAQRRANEIDLNEKAELEDRLSRPRWKPEEYKTKLGLRSLAVDPTNERVIMDLSGFMADILGCNPREPMSYTEFVALQTRLEKESVEKAKADGKHPNPKLCYMCRLLKLVSPTAEKVDSRPSFKWKLESLSLPFGTWQQLELRRHCSICRLVLSLVVTDPVTNTLHPRLAAIDREIQGVQLRVSLVQGSKEEILTVEYGMREVGELRMVTESNYTTALRQGWEAKEQCLEFQDFVRDAQEGQSRGGSNGPLCFMTGQQVDLRLLRRWLNDCELAHGEACISSDYYRGEHSDDAEIPLVVIDVIDNCLVPSTSAIKYFTLSYVWGTVDMDPTLLANYGSRCQKEGLPRQLPNTVADAIALVRGLNERYLWVDALCIVQDDLENKMRDIKRMDVIYSRAFATVVALQGASADAGLPGVRPGTRSPQQVEMLVTDAESTDLDYSPDFHLDPKSADRKEKVTLHLVATPPPLHLALETSHWETRGWTFQERLLSRRCLYFADQYVYFQCGRQVLSECGVNSPVRTKMKLWDEDSGNKAITTSLDNPLSDIHHDVLSDLAPEPCLAKTFAAYAKLVEKYTPRKLSYDGDIINAFLGTFAILNVSFQSDIVCGLPASALNLALLWAPTGRLLRRGHLLYIFNRQNMKGRPVVGQLLPTNSNTFQEVYGPSAQPTFDEKVDRRFPSWSWVGWTGAVEYRLFAEMLPDEPLPTSLIEEFVINLDEGELQTIPGRMQQKVVGPLKRGHPTSAALEDASASMINLTLNNAGTENKPTAPPSLPNVLQFRASTVPLSAFTISTQREFISTIHHIHSSSQQAVRHILDRNGKRCGLWWEQTGYVYIGRGVSGDAESKMILVGVSRHEDTFWKRSGPYRAEGEIKLFDDEVYPDIGPGSGLVNVLAVDLDMGHQFGERITVARIHARAWEEAGPVLKIVRLA
ncbi:uncharacterized protein PAC_15951 [Phialocephala subalpina]|uniref:Heterokaryon incompatibility domain-containing protein n=1 Tax=Phialocephala subalpina TaxID=576137 RepID=A0A1L7XLX0_9HELO|nr:uncharacterized protein PAC_15951 [Phialocephala subalpina]